MCEAGMGATHAGVVYREARDGNGSARISGLLARRQRQPGASELHPSFGGALPARCERERPAWRSFANLRSVAMNRSTIGAISLAGSTACSLSRPRISALSGLFVRVSSLAAHVELSGGVPVFHSQRFGNTRERLILRDQYGACGDGVAGDHHVERRERHAFRFA